MRVFKRFFSIQGSDERARRWTMIQGSELLFLRIVFCWSKCYLWWLVNALASRDWASDASCWHGAFDNAWLVSLIKPVGSWANRKPLYDLEGLKLKIKFVSSSPSSFLSSKTITSSMAKAMESKSTSRRESILIRYAIFSRLLVLFLTVTWRSFLQPYDTSAALNPPCLHHEEVTEESPPLNAVSKTLENSVVWDSVYFVRISQCGYEYEQTYAFLPLLPFFISLLSGTGDSFLSFWLVFLDLFEF